MKLHADKSTGTHGTHRNLSHSISRNALMVSSCMALVLTASSAFAQILPAAEPGRVEKRFEQKEMPPTVPQQVVPQAAAPDQGSVSGASHFTLSGVNIEGSTVYTPDELRALYADMMGKDITVNDVRSIAAAVTNKYRADGYVLSYATAPDQTISDGTVRIVVREGYVSSVSIEGDHVENSSHHLVENLANKIKESRPLNTKALERNLLLIDDLPGVTAKGVFRPSASDPAATEMVIVMGHKKYEGSMEVNNRGSKLFGPMQYQATLGANSLFGMYDRTIVRAITTSPTTELRFIDVQHEEQLGNQGTKLVVTASHLRTEPGEFLKPLEIEGRSTAVVAKVEHPFQRSRTKNLKGRVQFDYRNSTTDILGTEFFEDRLRVVRAGAAYDIADKWNGVNLVDAEASQGLGILGATDDEGLKRTRSDADSVFTKVNLNLARIQTLPYGFSLLAAASGQYAFDNLLASEQFGLGGIGFGQAYDPSELTGDHGAALKLEMRYGRGVGAKYLNSYQLYTYYDIGQVWTRDAGPGTENSQSLASVGVGARANFNQWWSGTAEMGIPLTQDVLLERDEDPRFFFSVIGRF